MRALHTPTTQFILMILRYQLLFPEPGRQGLQTAHQKCRQSSTSLAMVFGARCLHALVPTGSIPAPSLITVTLIHLQHFSILTAFLNTMDLNLRATLITSTPELLRLHFGRLRS